MSQAIAQTLKFPASFNKSDFCVETLDVIDCLSIILLAIALARLPSAFPQGVPFECEPTADVRQRIK